MSPLTVLLVSVNDAAAPDATSAAARRRPLRMVTPLMFTLLGFRSLNTSRLCVRLIAVDDGGRGSAAGDGEIAGDSEFSDIRVRR